jgi:hypothetical protein
VLGRKGAVLLLVVNGVRLAGRTPAGQVRGPVACDETRRRQSSARAATSAKSGHSYVSSSVDLSHQMEVKYPRLVLIYRKEQDAPGRLSAMRSSSGCGMNISHNTWGSTQSVRPMDRTLGEVAGVKALGPALVDQIPHVGLRHAPTSRLERGVNKSASECRLSYSIQRIYRAMPVSCE